jgi:hypothetical protein
MRKGIFIGFAILVFLQSGCDQLTSSSQHKKIEKTIQHMLFTNPVCKVIELKKEGDAYSPLTQFFLERELINDTHANADEIKNSLMPPFKINTKGLMYLKWIGQFNYAFCLPAPRLEAIDYISEPMPNPLADGQKTVDVVYSYTFPDLPDWAKEKSFANLLDDDSFRLGRFIREDNMPTHASVCLEINQDRIVPLKDKDDRLREKCREAPLY